MRPFGFKAATTNPSPTSFFGLVPDQYTLLVPGHTGSSSLGVDNITPARYPQQWTKYNTSFDGGANQDSVSFGATTLAPDGTTNVATKLVESNANSVHYIGALHGHQGYANTNVGQGPTFRIGVFAKAAERSRLCVKVVQSNGVGASIVWDLAGVQVGVAATVTPGNQWSLIGTPSIFDFGNGWRCCWYDVGTGDNTAVSPWYVVKLMLDSHTGTAAESTSYAGDGTSGLYVWSTVMLPPGAWGITRQTFFDDFVNGLPTVDSNKTYVPGFNWYLTQTTTPANWGINVPNSGWFNNTPANLINQVTPSFIQELNGASSFGGLCASICTCYGDNSGTLFPGGFVGRWFQPPYVQQMRSNGGLLGSWSLELDTDTRATTSTQQSRLAGAGEMEWSENQGGSPTPRATPTWWNATSGGGGPAGDNLSPFSCLPSALKWKSFVAYQQFSIVSYLGNLYANLSGTSTAGNDPITNTPNEWTAYNGTNPDSTVFSSNFSANFQALTPFDQYADTHIYSGLWFPGGGTAVNGVGWMGFFIDGVCFGGIRSTGSFSATSICTYGPTNASTQQWKIMESSHWPIFVSRGVDANFTMKVDYIKVLQ